MFGDDSFALAVDEMNADLRRIELVETEMALAKSRRQFSRLSRLVFGVMMAKSRGSDNHHERAEDVAKKEAGNE